MNNFNAIILFILVGYITYLFSKNMAIVLLVALLLTNLFMSSKTNRMGREGFQEGADGETDISDPSGNDPSGNDPSGNYPIAQNVKNAIATRKANQAAATTTTTTTSTPTTPTPAPTPLPGPVSPPMAGMQNMQNIDLDKLQGLLTQSQGLMKELKNAFPGMGNILGNLGQQ